MRGTLGETGPCGPSGNGSPGLDGSRGAGRHPVVLLAFNRPELTRSVFAAVREARPPKLFVVADGPRPGRPQDAEACAAVREVVEAVDWDCEVFRNYSAHNLGCQSRVSSGLDWVFDHVESAIILEDDCIPNQTFFPFCEQLLDRYCDDERVMVIAGNNFQRRSNRKQYSYYFSRYSHCWGWATWRRAWRHFDFSMSHWPAIRDSGILADMLGSRPAARYWTGIFEDTFNGAVNSWAYRWTFCCWLQGGLTILPEVNIVSNAGFGDCATHTTRRNRFAHMRAEPLTWPIRHPPFVVRDGAADRYTERIMFSGGLGAQVGRLLRAVARKALPR